MATIMNLEDFGYRELDMAADLLKAYSNGSVPDTFYESGVHIVMDDMTGNVFLTNDDGDYLVDDDDGNLVNYYVLSYSGDEGFAEDLYDNFKRGYIDEEDYEELASILEYEELDDEAEEVRKAVEY